MTDQIAGEPRVYPRGSLDRPTARLPEQEPGQRTLIEVWLIRYDQGTDPRWVVTTPCCGRQTHIPTTALPPHADRPVTICCGVPWTRRPPGSYRAGCRGEYTVTPDWPPPGHAGRTVLALTWTGVTRTP